MSKSLRVAVLGLGTVGSGIIRILQDDPHMIVRRAGSMFDIRYVVVRDLHKKRSVALPAGTVMTSDWRQAVTDPQVDVVVEVIGGITTAKDAVLAALQAGKQVVTANKALLATCGDEVFAAAKAAGVSIAFEAAVAGGIPIIATIGNSLTGNRVESIEAILNGTSNFILSEMANKKRAYAEVLAEAQRLGYAEADPTMDIDGTDAAQKLTLLTRLAYGKKVEVSQFLRQGINTLELADMLYADELGYRVKLLAMTRLVGQQLEMHVEPTLIRRSRAIARTDGAINIVELHGHAVGRLIVSGPGAGEMPTASAVVADLIDMAIGRAQLTFPRLEIWNTDSGLSVMPPEHIERRYYLRFNVADRPHVMADITDILGRQEISLASVIQHESAEREAGGTPAAVPLVIMTHRTTEGRMRAAEAQLAQLTSVRRPHTRMPVAD